jgi:hypothetical protein
MNLFASCPDCKLAVRLLPPTPNPENECGLLSNATEILPLMLNEQARWFCVCPQCRSRFIPLAYRAEPKDEDEAHIFKMLSLQKYRSLREASLQNITYAHLGKMLTQSSLLAWIFSCLAGLLWGLWSQRAQFLLISCGLVICFSFLLILLALAGERARGLQQLFGSFGAFFGTIGWLVVSAFLGRAELLIALGILLPCWIVSMLGVPKLIEGDTLIAVEQELLQLRPLRVVPRYWVKAEAPYR